MKFFLTLLQIGLVGSCQISTDINLYRGSNDSSAVTLTASTPVDLNIPDFRKLINGIVYLEYTSYGHGIKNVGNCNGVIIAPFKILTAAHCFYAIKSLQDKQQQPSTSQLLIQYGDVTADSSLMKQLTAQQIASIEIHKNYFSDQLRRKGTPVSAIEDARLRGSDQAIITLNQEALLNTPHYDMFKSVPDHYMVDNGSINKKETTNFEYSVLLAYTFYNKLNTISFEKAILYVSAGFIPVGIMEPSPFEPGVIIDEIIFLKNKKTLVGVCAGDSGAPVFYKLKNSDKLLLIGIISSGLESASSGPHCALKSIISLISNNKSWLNF